MKSSCVEYETVCSLVLCEIQSRIINSAVTERNILVMAVFLPEQFHPHPPSRLLSFLDGKKRQAGERIGFSPRLIIIKNYLLSIRIRQ